MHDKIKVGDKFGKWLVKDLLPDVAGRTRAQCTGCMTYHNTLTDKLLNGMSKGCRHCSTARSRLELKVGDAYGMWRVAGGKAANNTLTRVQCSSCDKITEISTSQLVHGIKRKCGSCTPNSGRLAINPGDTYNFWTVVDEVMDKEVTDKSHSRVFNCKCKCGTVKPVSLSSLRSGGSRSCKACGVLNTVPSDKTGDPDRVRTTRSFYALNSRVNDKGNMAYGGRGIRVCDRWNLRLNPKTALIDFISDMGIRPTNCTIDRIDVDGDYVKENCRWASVRVQSGNKTTSSKFQGQNVNIREIAGDNNIAETNLRKYFNQYKDEPNITMEEIITRAKKATKVQTTIHLGATVDIRQVSGEYGIRDARILQRLLDEKPNVPLDELIQQAKRIRPSYTSQHNGKSINVTTLANENGIDVANLNRRLIENPTATVEYCIEAAQGKRKADHTVIEGKKVSFRKLCRDAGISNVNLKNKIKDNPDLSLEECILLAQAKRKTKYVLNVNTVYLRDILTLEESHYNTVDAAATALGLSMDVIRTAIRATPPILNHQYEVLVKSKDWQIHSLMDLHNKDAHCVIAHQAGTDATIIYPGSIEAAEGTGVSLMEVTTALDQYPIQTVDGFYFTPLVDGQYWSRLQDWGGEALRGD